MRLRRATEARPRRGPGHGDAWQVLPCRASGARPRFLSSRSPRPRLASKRGRQLGPSLYLVIEMCRVGVTVLRRTVAQRVTGANLSRAHEVRALLQVNHDNL